MSKWKPWRCKDCKTTEPPISARGLCQDCAITRMTKSAVQQVAREGPHYDAWRERMIEIMPGRASRF